MSWQDMAFTDVIDDQSNDTYRVRTGYSLSKFDAFDALGLKKQNDQVALCYLPRDLQTSVGQLVHTLK